jgi:phosphate transport system protein
MAATHTDKAFEQDLRDLREKLLAIGAKVEANIADSVRALTERDSELAKRVTESDSEVNRLEVEIDEMCRRILALRQPAASDLRLITTALKIVTDLERIGDLAVNIAERAIDLNQVAPLAPYVDTPRLAELSQEQVKKALDAFVSADVAKAE